MNDDQARTHTHALASAEEYIRILSRSSERSAQREGYSSFLHVVCSGKRGHCSCKFNRKLGAWNHVLYTSTSLGGEKNYSCEMLFKSYACMCLISRLVDALFRNQKKNHFLWCLADYSIVVVSLCAPEEKEV
jgi:hypothetical protein